MLLIDDLLLAPFSGWSFIMRTLRRIAEEQWTDDAPLKQQLLELQVKLDDGSTFDRLLEEQTMPLADGDLYLFFTDGISEAMNVSDDCFGEARLGRILEEHAHLPSEELRERVLREVEAFVGDAPQHDDMTMILLRVESEDALHHA